MPSTCCNRSRNPGGGRLSFAYDGEGGVTAVTNKVGVAYDLIRDAAGRVIAEEDFEGAAPSMRATPAVGSSRRQSPTACGSPIHTTAPISSRPSKVTPPTIPDAAGFETAVTDANGNTTTKAYDIRGNVARLTDAEGRATTYAWGPHGDLSMVIDGAGKIRRWDNDLGGNTLAETCAEGHTTRYVRDERGRLIRTIFPDGAEESRAYDAHGRLVAITDARGGVTRFSHDPFGRVVAQTDALGHVTSFEYQAGAGGFSTPTATIRPDGVRLQRAFTEDGVLASVSDGEGRTWRYTYGAFDVLLAIQDPGGGKLSFGYDGEGRVVAVTNQTGVIYYLIRDEAGRVIAEEDFDGRRTEHTRDPAGRVIETKKPDGVRLAFCYDKTDRLASVKSYAAEASTTDAPLDETYYWYDRRGLLIKASNLAALVEFERDGNGRIIRETTNGRSIGSKLDARGNRIERRIGHWSGDAQDLAEGLVQIARDPLGMVAAITIDDHAPLTFTRDALGRETSRASAKGFRLDQSWDAVGQLMHQRVRAGVAERHYTWDKANAPTAIEDAIWGTTLFEYDVNCQVVKAEFGDGFSESFSYDPAKNVAGVALQGPGLDPNVSKLFDWRSTPGGVARLARGPNGESITLTQDACGRLVKRRVERKGFRPKTWEYHWDSHDRLVRCDNADDEIWFYRYDPFGRRLTKVRKLADKELAWTAQKYSALVPAAARQATKIWTWPEPPFGAGGAVDRRPPVVGTLFTWDGNVVAEQASLRLDGSTDWADATRWHFEPESFRSLAKQTRDGRLLPTANDHLGTPHEMFDEEGHFTWSASYSTWGAVRGVKAPTPANDDGKALYPRDELKGAIRGNLALQSAPAEAPSIVPFVFRGSGRMRKVPSRTIGTEITILRLDNTLVSIQ